MEPVDETPPPQETWSGWAEAMIKRQDQLQADLDKLRARMDLQARLERGEDGFDAY